MVHQISVRIADVHEELRRVLKHLNEFPSPASVEEVHGPSNKSVRHFHTQLSETARMAGMATEKVMTELAKMDSTIRAALDDLTNHDADLAASAAKFENFLDSAGEQPVPSEPAESAPVKGKGGGSYLPGNSA